MKYLKEFQTHAQYEAYTADTSNFILPNVSKCIQQDDIHYNPYVEPVETRLVTKYNVSDTNSETILCYNVDNFSAIEIDGVEQPSVISAYTFSTTGEHTVKYTLIDFTVIKENTFIGTQNLTSVIIPNSVTSIGNSAFQFCSGLTSCTIGSGVTTIGDGAFYTCNAITSVDIPDSVTTIGNWAFFGCKSFTSVTIPNSVTTIGGHAFYNCSGLTSITVNSTTPPTLSNVNAFDGTNNCPIYVPSGSVDAYKAANNWSSYASRIQAIP